MEKFLWTPLLVGICWGALNSTSELVQIPVKGGERGVGDLVWFLSLSGVKQQIWLHIVSVNCTKFIPILNLDQK